MIQPAQWMRFYAARSADVLRRSALIFAAVLTLCFFFGVMLVGLGGQVLYPLTDAHGSYLIDTAGKVLPHPAVGQTAGEFDQILVVVLKNHLPDLLGSFGAVLAALVLVAIMAAAVSVQVLDSAVPGAAQSPRSPGGGVRDGGRGCAEHPAG